MTKRRKIRNGRPKALFGEAAAIVAQTLAQVANATMQAQATKDAAKTQADSVLENAKSQAQAMQKQNDNNTKLQTQMMEFTKSQNDQNRQIMKDLQMNMQLAAGAQSARDRREASKLILRNGGRKRRKSYGMEFLLKGGNIPFRVTDGGGVIPIGKTSEGFDIFELYGNDHNHYHKAQGGKNKTGVGIKFADGVEIEGEGNQNTSNGELMVTTPDDAFFISKHTLRGFKPAKAVKQGMHPLEAYVRQERIKDVYGIDNEDSNSTPVERRRYNRSIGKNGTSVKQQIASLTNRRKLAAGGNWWLGPTISGAGNLLGAGLASIGIGTGSRYLSNRVGEAGDLLAKAYGQLQGVDFEDVFGGGANGKLSFSQGHIMPVVRSSYYNANPELAGVNRAARTQVNAVNNNTLSSAARLSRNNLANTAAAEARSKIYATKANAEEEIKQANIKAINEAAADNAALDIEMNKQYMGARADLAKFNANVANERILGAAEAKANALSQQGAIGAQSRQSIGNAWGSALSQTGLGFANAYNNYQTRQNELKMAMLSATPDSRLTYWSDPSTSEEGARNQITQWRAAADATQDIKQKAYWNRLADALENARGLGTNDIPSAGIWNKVYGVINNARNK